MTQEEKEYNEFMADISNKTKEMYEKYNALSVSNKKKFMLYIEPLVRVYGTQGFINEMNTCGENRSPHFSPPQAKNPDATKFIS